MTICYSSQVTGTGASPNGVLGFGPRLVFVVCVDGVQIMGLARWEAMALGWLDDRYQVAGKGSKRRRDTDLVTHMVDKLVSGQR